MAKTWQIPTGGDLWQIVSREVVEKTNEDSAGGTADGNDFDTELDSRAKEAVLHAVAEVRGAIESAGRYPLSVTAGSVPPEGFQHTLAIAAWRLALIKPSLLAVLMAEGGVYAPINQLIKDAKEWIKGLRQGGSFVLPEDPTGFDYTTAVSATNRAISGIIWGDNLADDTEYEQGFTRNGKIVNQLTQDMLTDESGGTTVVQTPIVAGTSYFIPTVGADPNGLITATRPAVAYDAAGAFWVKTGSGTNNTGWEQRL